MVVTKRHLDRRTFLRGIGVTVALPWLDAMMPALTAVGKAPAQPARRLGFVYLPNGMNMQQWVPATEGVGFELSPLLQQMQPFKRQLIVLSGLSQAAAKPRPGEGAGDHARGCATFLTGVHVKKTPGFDIRAGVSADQIAAQELGKESPIPSLEIGLDSISLAGSCDFDYSCAYVNTVSWRSPTTPNPVEISPRIVFERLFGEGRTTDPQARAAQLRANRSILDSVLADVQQLEQGLGPRDRLKLDEYLEAVRDIERRIQRAEEQVDRELPLIDRPTDIPPSFEAHAKLMLDLNVLAFQANLTRVSTFMMGREVSNRSYPEIGVTDSHHPLSHHQNDPAKLERLAKINAFHLRQVAHFLHQLSAVQEAEGTLLDHSLIVCGAGLSDSNAHGHDDLPIFVAGALRGDRHLRYPRGTPLNNLWMSVLARSGVRADMIGDATGQLGDLLEL